MLASFNWLRSLLAPRIDLAAADGFARARTRLDRWPDPRIFTQLNARKATRRGERSVDFLRALYFLRLNQPRLAVEALKEELRYFSGHEEARQLLQRLAPAAPAPDDPSEYDRLAAAVRPWTMLDEARLRSLHDLARAVCEEHLPGNFVECGVAAGGSSALLAAVVKQSSRCIRKLYACDTFSGMPGPGKADTYRGTHAEETGWGTGTCAAPVASLLEVCALLDVQDLVVPVPGLFEETLAARKAEIGPVAFLHMDGDWYSSTRAILDHLYDSVVPGGRIQIDDYGHWEGCRQAVEEFASERRLKFTFHQIDEVGVWLRKPAP